MVLLCVSIVGITLVVLNLFLPNNAVYTILSNVTRPVFQDSLPHADTNRFSIAVAHLENDTQNQQSEKLLIEALRDFEAVQVLKIDRTITISEGSVPEESEKTAEEEAKEYLRETGADVLIWGTVLTQGDKVSPKLWWSNSSDVARGKHRDIYVPENFRLPQLFWSDLAEIVGMLVLSQVDIVLEREGTIQADKLKLYTDRVSNILETSEGKFGWNEEERASTSLVLAYSLTILGEQTRKNKPIKQAIAACRKGLRFYTLEKTPYEWAATNLILGMAFMILGQREIGTERSKDAVAAFQEAIKGFPRDKRPYEWAAVQFLLGSGIFNIGEQELSN